jgi:hypothetical protein
MSTGLGAPAGADARQAHPAEPRRSGIAGLTVDHWHLWAAGASLREIGEMLGIKAQTVHDAFQRRGWRRDNAPPPEPTLAPTEPPKPPEGLTEDERATIAARAHKTLLRGVLILAGEATAGLEANKGKHSPATLNGYGRTLRTAGELLAVLLHPGDEAGDHLPTLHIEVMSEAQAAARKAAAEHDDEDECKDEDNKIAEQKAPISISEVLRPPVPAADPESVVSRLPLLPAPGDYRAWLEALGAQHGRRFVRVIAEAVSGREIGAGADMEYLVKVILHVTQGDPRVLRNKLDIKA